MCAKSRPPGNGEAAGRDKRSAAGKLARIAQLEAEIAILNEMSEVEKVVESGRRSSDGYNEDLRRFVDSNIIPMHRADIYGNIYELNDAMIELLGYSREEFVSGALRWTQITPPEHAHLDARAVAQIKATGKALPWQKQYICKDGSIKTCLVGVVAADKSGKDCFAFCINITERTRIKEDLRASEAKFRMLAEAIPHIVWLADLEGRVLYHNERYYEYTGHKREDDDGLLWKTCVHPDDLPLFMLRFNKASKNHAPFECEYRYRSKTGEYRWYLARGLPLPQEREGKLIFFGTCTDIDNRKQQEEDIRESEIRFNTLANAIPQIVWTAEPSGAIDFFNDRWFEYTGLTSEQSKNDGWQLLIHPDDLKQYMRGWRHALKTGDSFETEFRLKRALFGANQQGKHAYRWHLCRAVSVRNAEGEIAKWFATWTEIEDQKTRQK